MKAKGPALAIVFGKGKPSKGGREDMEDDEYEDDEYSDDGLEEFEQQIIEAFPELEDDPKRIDAFWKAIKACVKA